MSDDQDPADLPPWKRLKPLPTLNDVFPLTYRALIGLDPSPLPGQPVETVDLSDDAAGREGGPSADTDQRWLTVTQAATVAGTDRGMISRAVDARKLKSNGKSGRARRIDAIDLIRWIRERSERPEPVESDEQVRRLTRKAGFNE
jgi:hypothetical protein